jgi:diguanylate cyclase (GGDEF)-like protein
MSELSSLFDVDKTEVYRLRFMPSIEKEYRISARGMRRYTRTLLLTLLGLVFAFAPMYENRFYGVSESIRPLLRIIEWGVVTPVAIAAAVATYTRLQKDFTYALQTTAVLCIWGSALLLRRLALEGQMHYSNSMIIIVVLTVAIFAGFHWYRILFAASACLLLASLQEYALNVDNDQAWLYINDYVWTWLIAVLGSYVNETRFRLAWINGRSAMLLAKTDILTGLSNRLEFNQLFPRIIKQASRDRSTIAVALIDIDRFKKINDTFGHAYGDEVLRAVGTMLMDNPPRRPLDLKVWYGGEELVIVWHAISPAALPKLIDETLSAIRGVHVDGPDRNQPISVTASIGVTYLTPDETTKPQAIMAFADRLMYQAKAEGRNRAIIEPFMNDPKPAADGI